MAKFKVGDRVRVVSRGEKIIHWLDVGTETVVMMVDENDQTVKVKNANQWISESDLEPATPTEHPALTLAKAEVVRLTGIAYASRSLTEDDRLEAFQEILAAFGLEYRAKPVVPQPVEYEFVSIEPEQGA